MQGNTGKFGGNCIDYGQLLTVMVRLRFSVKPNARINGLEIDAEGQLKVKIAAPPVDGKANQEICRYLAKVFGLSQCDVELQNGLRGRYKTMILQMEEDAFQQRLKELIG
jgi:uncharacterized protein (TIGR00251 family)